MWKLIAQSILNEWNVVVILSSYGWIMVLDLISWLPLMWLQMIKLSQIIYSPCYNFEQFLNWDRMKSTQSSSKLQVENFFDTNKISFKAKQTFFCLVCASHFFGFLVLIRSSHWCALYFFCLLLVWFELHSFNKWNWRMRLGLVVCAKKQAKIGSSMGNHVGELMPLFDGRQRPRRRGLRNPTRHWLASSTRIAWSLDNHKQSNRRQCSRNLSRLK